LYSHQFLGGTLGIDVVNLFIDFQSRSGSNDWRRGVFVKLQDERSVESRLPSTDTLRISKNSDYHDETAYGGSNERQEGE
jgi:hypothetical protein